MQSGILWIFGLILALVVIAVLIVTVVLLARARKKSAGTPASGGVPGNAAYCANCGRPLHPGNRFCTNCGAPIQTGTPGAASARSAGEPAPVQPQQPVWQGQPVPPQPFPSRKKTGAGKIVAIVLAAVAAVALLAVLLFTVVLPRFGGQSPQAPAPTATPAPAASDSQPEESPAPGALAHYENATVGFALDYPEDARLTEPNANNVLITDGASGAFQVSVEYAWHTQGDSAIYDAEDFARQIGGDPQVLYDWLGTDAVEIAGPTQTRIAGTVGTEYGLRLDLDGQPRSGSLVLFDGDSAFGCYTFLSLYSEEYADQAAAIRDSVEITGAYTYEGYSLYENREGGWRFLLRDGAVDGEIELEADEMTIYPVDGVYSDCNIWLSESAFSPEEDTVEEALEAACAYYFNYHDNTGYTSQISRVQYGRYPCWEVDLEYDGGKKLAQFLLEIDGAYWDLSMEAAEEYYETGKAVVSDVILSLRFDEGAAALRATPTPAPTPRPTATPAPTYNDWYWQLTVNGVEMVRIHMPYAWTEDIITVTDLSNRGSLIAGLRFSDTGNSAYGGHLVTVAIYENGGWEEIPNARKLNDLYFDGRWYEVVAYGPSDVQYDSGNGAKADEYRALYADVETLLSGIDYYQGS